MRELYIGDDGTQLTHVGKDFIDGRTLSRGGALHRGLEGRDRGRRLDRPPAGLRCDEALPGHPHHPRRAVHAVRHRLLRRGAGDGRGRIRRPVLEPARRLRLLGGVGTRDPRTGRRRGPRLGHRRLRGRHGGRRHGARAVRLPRRRPHGRHRRLVRRLHDLVDRRAHEPLQGGDLRAARQQPREHVRLERPLLGVRAQFGGPMWDNVERTSRSRRRRTRRTSRRPLLVLHSENDLRCTVEQGEHLFTLLRLLGKEVEIVRFPAESHELTRSGSPTPSACSASRRFSSASRATSSP